MCVHVCVVLSFIRVWLADNMYVNIVAYNAIRGEKGDYFIFRVLSRLISDAIRSVRKRKLLSLAAATHRVTGVTHNITPKRSARRLSSFQLLFTTLCSIFFFFLTATILVVYLCTNRHALYSIIIQLLL